MSIKFANFLHDFSTTLNHPLMKNRTIVHAHQEVEIYRKYYKPSFNVLRFTKSILSVLFFGTSTCANYVTAKKRTIR